MNGMGNRFIAAGYTDPKWKIQVSGKMIIEHVCDLFPGETDFTFLINEEHEQEANVREILSSLRPGCKIITVPYRKKGPVPAMLEAHEVEAYIEDDEPYMVSYCDYGGGWDWGGFKKKMIAGDYDGGIPCYTGFHPPLIRPGVYGGCLVDENNDLLEMREKHSFTEDKTQSHHAAGMYYFKSGKIMKEYCERCMAEVEPISNGEWYTSMPYYLMQEDGLKTHVFEMDKFFQWGTPLDLKDYEYWEEVFRK